MARQAIICGFLQHQRTWKVGRQPTFGAGFPKRSATSRRFDKPTV
jgi:hypothetical protein